MNRGAASRKVKKVALVGISGFQESKKFFQLWAISGNDFFANWRLTGIEM